MALLVRLTSVAATPSEKPMSAIWLGERSSSPPASRSTKPEAAERAAAIFAGVFMLPE
jgi:hypothetical protein